MSENNNNRAAQLLETLLQTRALASRYEEFMEVEMRNGSSFYPRVLAQEGKDAAEAALAKWAYRLSDFAAAIEPAARGMLAMARIDTDGDDVRLVECTEKMIFPRCHQIYGPSQMIVVFNRQAPGCGCNAPARSDVFALYGTLALKAVTLQAGHDYKGARTAQLGLVLPLRFSRAEDANDNGFAVATIQLSGRYDCPRLFPQFFKDGYLRYALGLLAAEETIGCMKTCGGTMDSGVGFPGATDYLANVLAGLGEYFTDLAARLSCKHSGH